MLEITFYFVNSQQKLNFFCFNEHYNGTFRYLYKKILVIKLSTFAISFIFNTLNNTEQLANLKKIKPDFNAILTFL